MLTASALNSSEYRRRVFLIMNTSNASSMRLTGVSAPIRPVQTFHKLAATGFLAEDNRLGITAPLGHHGGAWQAKLSEIMAHSIGSLPGERHVVVGRADTIGMPYQGDHRILVGGPELLSHAIQTLSPLGRKLMLVEGEQHVG